MNEDEVESLPEAGRHRREFTDPATVALLSRWDRQADRAWELRVTGLPWRMVAQQSGYTDEANCRRAVTSRFGRLPEPERVELRALWRDRIERLWRQSVLDVAAQRPGAVTAAVRVTQAACALDGLTEPTRIETRVTEQFAGILVELRREDLL